MHETMLINSNTYPSVFLSKRATLPFEREIINVVGDKKSNHVTRDPSDSYIWKIIKKLKQNNFHLTNLFKAIYNRFINIF